MYGVELYAAVRLAVVDGGLSHHEAGRRFGIDRRTVKKMLSYSAPPGYRRTKPVRRPKLGGFTGIVDAILEAGTDPDVPRKQAAALLADLDALSDLPAVPFEALQRHPPTWQPGIPAAGPRNGRRAKLAPGCATLRRPSSLAEKPPMH